MKAADFVSGYKISRSLDMHIEKSNRVGSTGRRGFVPTWGKLPRTKTPTNDYLNLSIESRVSFEWDKK